MQIRFGYVYPESLSVSGKGLIPSSNTPYEFQAMRQTPEAARVHVTLAGDDRVIPFLITPRTLQNWRVNPYQVEHRLQPAVMNQLMLEAYQRHKQPAEPQRVDDAFLGRAVQELGLDMQDIYKRLNEMPQ